MHTDRRPSRQTRHFLGTALTTAGVMGAAWILDAQRRSQRSAVLHRTLIDLLLNAMNAGDPVTQRHCRRVAALTDVLAARYRFTGERRARLRVASLLHDMGKIDDRFFHIVHSCEPLSKEDRHLIEKHPSESADILRPLGAIHPGIEEIVESHHECWDGSGYPKALKGEEIPFEARLIIAADVFDALTQPRSYREPLCVDDALAKLRESSGTRFDPRVVDNVCDREIRESWERIALEGQDDERRDVKADQRRAAEGVTG